MLSVRTHLRQDGIELADVACSHGRGQAREPERAGIFALVFVRRGCFGRSADGNEMLLDPTLAYCMSPGQEQRYDHPHEGGDDCTSLTLSAELAAGLWGGEPALPPGPLPVGPKLDLEHRRLLAAARAGDDDPHALVERALVLAAQTLEQVDQRRLDSTRPSTRVARAALADGVRELLVEDRDRSLPQLAHALAVSPHHLSRVFSELTGRTISRHRMRLRVREALERLAQGERDLARLAADVGFADQSHLCRVVARETSTTPSALRAALAAAAAT
jgi:AraC-like DNA-binding protein